MHKHPLKLQICEFFGMSLPWLCVAFLFDSITYKAVAISLVFATGLVVVSPLSARARHVLCFVAAAALMGFFVGFLYVLIVAALLDVIFDTNCFSAGANTGSSLRSDFSSDFIKRSKELDHWTTGSWSPVPFDTDKIT